MLEPAGIRPRDVGGSWRGEARREGVARGVMCLPGVGILLDAYEGEGGTRGVPALEWGLEGGLLSNRTHHMRR